MTSFFIQVYLIFSYASVLSYTLLNEPYSSQLIGGASEVDQHAGVLCFIPSLSPYWVFKLTMWMRPASRFQLCRQRRPLWEMGNMASVCAIHQSEHEKEKSVCFQPSVRGVYCFHAEVCWGSEVWIWHIIKVVKSESGVLSRNDRYYCEVCSQNRVLDKLKSILHFFPSFWMSL